MPKQRLEIEISGNDSKFGAVADRTRSRLNAISGVVKGMAATMAVSLGVRSVKHMVEFSSNVVHMADALQVSTKSIQEWAYAIEAAGGSLQDIERSVAALGRAVKTALEGGEGSNAAQSFARLGVTFEDLKTLRLEDIFLKIARNIGDAEDKQRLLGDALQTMGRSATSVLAAMANGFITNVEEAEKLGVAIDENIVRKMEEADTAWGKMKFFVRGKATSLVTAPWRMGEAMARDMMFKAMAKAVGSEKLGAAITVALTGGLKGEGDTRTRQRFTAEDFGDTGAGSSAAEASIKTSQTASDALARIGLFRGGSGTAAIERRKVSLLEQIATSTSRTASILTASE